jgi:hypothetical protein
MPTICAQGRIGNKDPKIQTIMKFGQEIQAGKFLICRLCAKASSVFADISDDSGKVDIALQPGFAGAGQKPQEVFAFGLARPAALPNDKPCGRRRAGQLQKILPVASDHDEFSLDGVIPDIRVIGPRTERLRDQ